MTTVFDIFEITHLHCDLLLPVLSHVYSEENTQRRQETELQSCVLYSCMKSHHMIYMQVRTSVLLASLSEIFTIMLKRVRQNYNC